MSSYLIDTSVIIDYLRGKKDSVTLLNNIEGELFSSYICLAELFEGVYRVRDVEEMGKVVTNFFSTLSGIYSIDWAIAKKFGEIRADLKKKGKIIEDLDLLLAATCLVHNLTLITFNQKHFSRIDNLRLYPT